MHRSSGFVSKSWICCCFQRFRNLNRDSEGDKGTERLHGITVASGTLEGVFLLNNSMSGTSWEFRPFFPLVILHFGTDHGLSISHIY